MVTLLNHILDLLVTGLFTALFLLAFSWFGLFPLVLFASKSEEEIGEGEDDGTE